MKIRKKITSVAIASVITLVFFLLFLAALFLKIDQEINNLADYTYDYTKEMNDSIDLVLNHLKNRNEFESLLSMRIELFRNDYIRDIFYFKNDYIILSSVLGNISIPQLKLEPDLVHNSKNIWFKHSVVYDYYVYTSSLIRSGNYGILINNDFYNNLDSGYEWELVLENKDGYNHYLGEKNLYNDKKQGLTLNGYYKSIDFKEDNYRMALFISYKNIVRKESIFLQLVSTFTIIIFLTTYYITMNFKKLFDDKYIRIKKGLDKEKFYFVYQPIIELSTGEIKGMEVLARFKDKKGMIYPDEFIPILIKQKKTWEFTKYLFNKVHETLDESTLDTKDFRVSINIFPSDIINMNVLELMFYKDMISEYNMFIEVIEDQYLEKKEANIAIKKLKDMGFRIAIDDFGTGYSNLSSLKNLDIDYLKIDKSFIFEMEDSTIKSSLIPHIIDISNSLELSCVAEGIENTLQLEILKRWGVKYGQGYYFSKPIAIEKFEILYEKQPFKSKKTNILMVK